MASRNYGTCEYAKIFRILRRKPAFELLNNLIDIMCGHVRKFVKHTIIFWTIHLLDMAQNCRDNCMHPLGVLIVLLLLARNYIYIL